MIPFIFKLIKKVIFSSILIYSFDVFAPSLNIVIPINFFTILLVVLFDIPAMLCLIIFSLAF